MLFLITTASAVDIFVNMDHDDRVVSGNGANWSIMKKGPVAAFSGIPTSGPKPLNVTFSDASTGNITSYAWNFGDGMTSSLRNPSHEYTAVGSYTVTLTVTDPDKSDVRTNTNYIRVSESPPSAAFSGTPVSGQKPLNVAFTDSSTGVITTYAWDFGDRNTSVLRNPSHLYTTAGSYVVNLTVTGPGGSDFETKTNYILVTNTTTKIGIYKDGTWYLDYNGNGIWDAGIDKLDYFGTVGWTPVVGNWNGDPTGTKIGIYKDGAWYLDNDGSGTWNNGDRANTFGALGWTPVAGNWNGDATGTKIGIYNDGTWYLDWNGNGAWDAGIDKVYTFGAAGWTPVTGDWNGNGIAKIGIYKDGGWYVDYNGNGAWESGDKECLILPQKYTQVVVGDWNGDGKSEIGYYRWGFWSLDYLGEGYYSKFSPPFFGQEFDYVSTPVVGDWNGDNKTKIGLYQYTNGVWYLDNDGSGTWNAGDRSGTFGALGWTPVVGKWS